MKKRQEKLNVGIYVSSAQAEVLDFSGPVGVFAAASRLAAGIETSLHLVARLGGEELAERAARQMEFPWNLRAAPRPDRARLAGGSAFRHPGRGDGVEE